jgi:protoporphyrinogen oxidase
MAGFGAAHRLHVEGESSVLYDMHAHYGGHTASYQMPQGYTIDEGPHVSFTKHERVKSLLAGSVEQEFEESVAYVNNYWRGYWIDHPAQCNLYGLPPDLVATVIEEFVAAQHAPEPEIRNYEDWLRASYGDTFAETFPMEYTKKYHTTHARNLTTDWIGPRLYRPELREVLRGALCPDSPNVHYITQFRYPKTGGFVAFLRDFSQQTDVRLNHRLVKLDPRRHQLTFANGVVEDYERVVSSIPLPELIPMIAGAPREVVEAAAKLACS